MLISTDALTAADGNWRRSSAFAIRMLLLNPADGSAWSANSLARLSSTAVRRDNGHAVALPARRQMPPCAM